MIAYSTKLLESNRLIATVLIIVQLASQTYNYNSLTEYNNVDLVKDYKIHDLQILLHRSNNFPLYRLFDKKMSILHIAG